MEDSNKKSTQGGGSAAKKSASKRPANKRPVSKKPPVAKKAPAHKKAVVEPVVEEKIEAVVASAKAESAALVEEPKVEAAKPPRVEAPVPAPVMEAAPKPVPASVPAWDVETWISLSNLKLGVPGFVVAAALHAQSPTALLTEAEVRKLLVSVVGTGY